MYIIFYILLFSFVIRIISALLFASPLFAILIIGVILYALYRNKKQMQAYVNNQQHTHSYTNYRTYEKQSDTTHTSPKTDVFEAEYTETEVH
ncbi:MAG: hypothetical protein IJP28_05395 [Erysipelotrichales bacterium]|nr:hypothetical protein [Erysipelotrichales bacterium]